MSRLPWVRLVLLLLGVLATAWWWSGQADREPTPIETPAAVASPAITPSPQASLRSTEPPSLEREAAATAAREVLTSWARPHLDYEQWWRELKPLLTVEGQESYEYTDPSTIPSLTVTGPATEDPAPLDPYVTTFWFQTSDGRFGVDVARSPSGGPWQAFSIIFPGNESRRQ